MGKEPKNGFYYISVQHLARQLYGTTFFRHFPCCSCTDTVCIAVCS